MEMVILIKKCVFTQTQLFKGEKILPENNAFGDKYNVIGKLFYI
jgi:hypothetical protein